jgi:hypothetical protein
MATDIPDSPSCSPSPPPDDLAESSKVTFDDPDGDFVLRSHDSQALRVLKLYIIKSSSVLAELIGDASDPSGVASSTNAQTQLPEVRLPESSAILSGLLTFIFPVAPVLPSTLQETMELLSVAQKYKMSSVLTHIRGSLSLKNPPFINPENAFFAYSLAQEYGLREEATQAARLTLEVTLTIANLEDKLAMVSGAEFYELWKYHQRVQAKLRSDLPSSGAGAELKGHVKCSQQVANTGNPYWIELYIWSIIESPTRFDLIEFQMALARHIAGIGGTKKCASCANIPVKVLDSFWTTLAAAAHRCMEEVSIVYGYCTLRILQHFRRPNLRCQS